MPFSSNLVSAFWRENSNMAEITKESLTFEKNVPLRNEKIIMMNSNRHSSVTNFIFFLRGDVGKVYIFTLHEYVSK